MNQMQAEWIRMFKRENKTEKSVLLTVLSVVFVYLLFALYCWESTLTLLSIKENFIILFGPD